MNENSREHLVTLLNDEMNRFWTRFNIFSIVQVGALLSLANAAKFLVANIMLFRSALLLLVVFSISGTTAFVRGFDLQQSFTKNLIRMETSLPKQERIISTTQRYQRLPSYTNTVTCSLFGVICSLLWVIGWIWLELTDFKLTLN